MNRDENFIVEKNTIDGTPPGGMLRLDSNRLAESIAFMQSEGIKNLGIDRNQKFQNLNFLKDFSFIEGLQIDADVDNIEGINSLKELRFLLLGQNMTKKEIHFDNFKYLEYCILDWNKNKTSILKAESLLKLSIYNFSGVNLNEFYPLINLTNLFLSKSKLTDFGGIEFLINLKKLEVYYLSRLERIESIKDSSKILVEVCFNNCKKIKDHQNISSVKSLDTLWFNYCSDIKNLKFLQEMNLKEFRFVGTNIIDGDLSYCKKIPRTIFSDKKHFSHTFKELNSK